MRQPAFSFAVCNVGSEAWLVREVERLVPGAAASYRRKGLVTFKLPEGKLPGGALEGAVFARVHGESLGLAADLEAVRALVRERVEPETRWRLHVYPRADTLDDASVAHARAIETAVRADGGILEGARAADGERVIDVIVGVGEASLVGVRTQRGGWRVPGGQVAIEVPPESPSRAYVKLEEALAWSELAVPVGALAIEIGSAPGGAALALARRGVSVLAVDPAEMDPRVLAFVGPGGARVVALARTAGSLRREEVDRRTSLLLCDANLAPPVVLRTVTSIVSWLRGPLCALILTLKLNDDHMAAAIPELLARVRALGFEVAATQLPSNRREICVVARAR